MKTEVYGNVPYLKSLSACLQKITVDGYTDNFTVTSHGILSYQKNKTYSQSEIKVINFFRFEGNTNSNKDNMAVLYVIETKDGNKGTLIDTCGTLVNTPGISSLVGL